MEVKNPHKRRAVHTVNLMVERASSEISISHGPHCTSAPFYNFGHSAMIIRKVHREPHQSVSRSKTGESYHESGTRCQIFK